MVLRSYFSFLLGQSSVTESHIDVTLLFLNCQTYHQIHFSSFLIGRYLLRDWVERRLVHKYQTIQALDVAFQQNGLTIFFLLRLSPVVPFNAINYIGGVTSMKFRHFIIALVGLAPGTVLYCFIGATAGSLTESKNAVSGPLAIASLVVGSVLGLLAIVAVSYYAKREFNRIVAEEQARKREEQEREEYDGFSIDGFECSHS
jgi:hypothetical protein